MMDLDDRVNFAGLIEFKAVFSPETLIRTILLFAHDRFIVS